jgi:TonB-dependent SusC/RagA subfamily outer membrane receptor
MISRKLTLLSILFFAFNIYSQDKNKKIIIKGILKTDTNLPVSKASIYVDNKNTKRVTDSQGLFLIVCAKNPKKIKFVHQTYGIKEVKYKGDSIISIVINDKHIIKKTTKYNRYDNIFDYLRGQPGVIINNRQIFIRGINSINSSTAPLILLNGNQINDISSININDVKLIRVLKKPNEIAMYGVRGANGVIMIKTY